IMADVNVNAPADQAPTIAPPTRTDDKILPHIRWNLAQHTHKKKKATLIVIPSIRFTKMIIYYLQSKHKFHLRQDSPLHFPNGEPVLGYLKFSAKGTKQEVFGMPIPNKIITADIQGKQYYKEYMEKVAEHQRYLAGKKGSDPDSPAPKASKATKKSKPSAPKADLRPPVIKLASSQQPKPKPPPAKSQGKIRKLVTETSDKPSPARKYKPGLVTQQHKPTSSLRSTDESVDEGIPEKEPRFDDEEDDIQRAVEESLKSVYDAPQSPLPLVVIREPDSRKFQPLPEIQGKGKEKVNHEQRRTSASNEPSGQAESSSIYVTPRLTDSASEYDEEVPSVPQPQSSPVVHARPNLEYIDLKAMDVSTQLLPEQMDKGFATSAYLNVHKNLKLTVEEQVILKESASSIGTLSSLQHLSKDIIFGDLFFNDKPSEAENEKTTAKTKAESIVSVIIQQDTSAILPMTTSNRFGDLPEADMKEILHQRMWETNSYKAHEDHMMLYEALEKYMNRDHTDELLKDLAEARKKNKKRRDSLKMPHGSPPHQPPPPPPPAGPSRSSGSLRASGSSQVPPPPPSTNQEGQWYVKDKQEKDKIETKPDKNEKRGKARQCRRPITDNSVNPPHIDECCCECGDALDGIFCEQCTCKSCGKGAHIGYNCPPKVPIISNPEPCNQTMNNELPQTLPSFVPTCYSDKENLVPCVSKPNFIDESSYIFNPPPQPLIYSCEFYGSNAQYGHYYTSQVLFIYPEQGYSQDFNFSQDIHDFQQQYLCYD
nr:hypothetical protein [Tanacetum cinerariifolium]